MDTVGILALLLLGMGALTLLVGLRERALARRSMVTPTTPIAYAKGDGVVEIKGTFRRGEGAAERLAPFTGKPALWWRVKVQSSSSNQDGSTSYSTHHEETSVDPLWIEDGSGQMARVDTERGGRFEVCETRISDPPPDAEDFCARNHLPWKKGRYSYCVQVICAGEVAYALGRSRREAGEPRADGYRDVATTQLVLFGPDVKERPWDRGEELLVSNEQEEALVANLTTSTFFGCLAVALGLVTGCIWLYARLAHR